MTSSHPFLEWIFMRRIPWSGLQIWCAGVKNGGLCWDVGWKMSNEHGCVIFGWPSMKGSLHSLWLGYFQQSPSNFPDLHRWMWSQQDPFSECKPWAKCEEVSEISMGKTAFSCLWKGGMRVISPLLCFHDPMSHMARGVSPHLAEWGSYVGICEINASKERCLIYRLKIWLHYEDSKDWNWTWACSRLWSSMSPERLTRFGLHPSDCVANQYGRIERSPPGGRWFDPRCTRITDITSGLVQCASSIWNSGWFVLTKLSHPESLKVVAWGVSARNQSKSKSTSTSRHGWWWSTEHLHH